MSVFEGMLRVGPITTYVCTYCNFFCEIFPDEPSSVAKRLSPEQLEECIQKRDKKSPWGCYEVTYISALDAPHIITKWSRSNFSHKCVESLGKQTKLAKKILEEESRLEGALLYAVHTYHQVTGYGTAGPTQYTYKTEPSCCSLKIRKIR